MPWRGRGRPAPARWHARLRRPRPRSWKTRGDYVPGLPALYDRRMAGRVEHYRAELKKRRGEWEPYLKANSGLPGPRANLELVTAVGEEADADLLWRFSASSDEVLALCGTAGVRRLAMTEPETVLPWLKELAEDPRWRVREGVAIALQRLGHASMSLLIAEMEVWSKGG